MKGALRSVLPKMKKEKRMNMRPSVLKYESGRRFVDPRSLTLSMGELMIGPMKRFSATHLIAQPIDL